MRANFSIPTVDDVLRIANIADPVLRNLQITQCYHELSAAFAVHTGQVANWCTFATWASKQAGQTIRKEDLARMFERRFVQASSAIQAAGQVTAVAHARGQAVLASPQALALWTQSFTSAIDRAGDAVGRGNKKVFEEIGYEFARFLQFCLPGGQPDDEKVALFCEQLLSGEPPDGQVYLRQAFIHYSQALLETSDQKVRAELILLANLEIGFHEQTRLQPEIAESLDAGFTSFLEFSRALLGSIFPKNSWLHLAYLYLMRLLGRPTGLDLAIRALLAEMRGLLRQVITETMMKIALPSGVVLRLGEDLAAGFPERLKHITNLELRAFLARHDQTPDSLTGTGALDWADLSDRLHFIADFFRCYQDCYSLFEPPFAPEQVDILKGGRLPKGRL